MNNLPQILHFDRYPYIYILTLDEVSLLLARSIVSSTFIRFVARKKRRDCESQIFHVYYWEMHVTEPKKDISAIEKSRSRNGQRDVV